MGFFSFGKKKKRSVKKKKVVRKPPAKLLKMCKKLKIKVTIKRGKKKVYKSVKVLKKLISKKRKQLKKKKSPRRNRFSFGNSAPFVNPAGYGYNQPVIQNQGILNQSSQMVTSSSDNANRPPGLNLPNGSVPTYGVYRPFFTEQVPTQVGPRDLGFMGQPDGSLYPVGGPFSGYKTPSFGKRRRMGFGKTSMSSSQKPMPVYEPSPPIQHIYRSGGFTAPPKNYGNNNYQGVTCGNKFAFPIAVNNGHDIVVGCTAKPLGFGKTSMCPLRRRRRRMGFGETDMPMDNAGQATSSPTSERGNVSPESPEKKSWWENFTINRPSSWFNKTGFGRKQQSCKPSKTLLCEAKRAGIKVTRKVGGKRVYKTEAALKKQLR